MMISKVESLERPEHVTESRYIDYDIYAPVIPGKDFHLSWKVLQDSA